jgi:hypothetical protein
VRLFNRVKGWWKGLFTINVHCDHGSEWVRLQISHEMLMIKYCKAKLEQPQPFKYHYDWAGRVHVAQTNIRLLMSGLGDREKLQIELLI